MSSNENSEIMKESEIPIELNEDAGDSDKIAGFSASETIKEWLQISQDFQAGKKAFKSYKNLLIEFVFEKIGYKYKGHIKRPNFLHLSAEAWLLGLFHEIEREISAEPIKEDFTFTNLINLISQIIVKENVFIENMEILISKFSYLTAYENQEKIFRNVLIDLNSSKNEVLKDEKILKNNALNCENFIKTLEKILLISFNLYLNNNNFVEENNRNFTLYEIIEAFKADEGKKELKFEEFLSAYKERKNLSEVPKENFRYQLLGYLNFAESSFADLTSEIKAFNKNSRLIYKVFALLPKRLTFTDFAELVQNKLDFLKKYGLDLTKVKNLNIETVQKFIESCFAESKKALTHSYQGVSHRIDEAKSWINSIELVKSAKDASYTLYGKSREYFAAPLEFAYGKLNFFYGPLKTTTLELKEKAFSYVLTLKENTEQKVLGFKKLIFDFVARNFQALKNFISGENPLFKLNSKDDGFYSIEINKKLLFLNPALFYEFFDFVKGILAKVYDLRIVKGVLKVIGMGEKNEENEVNEKDE